MTEEKNNKNFVNAKDNYFELINNLPKNRIISLLFFSIISAGIYSFYWLYKVINTNSFLKGDHKIDKYLPFYILFIFLSVIISEIAILNIFLTSNYIIIISRIAGFLGLILFYLMVFKLKKILEEILRPNIDMKIKISNALTFIFTIYYFQYIINKNFQLTKTMLDKSDNTSSIDEEPILVKTLPKNNN